MKACYIPRSLLWGTFALRRSHYAIAAFLEQYSTLRLAHPSPSFQAHPPCSHHKQLLSQASSQLSVFRRLTTSKVSHLNLRVEESHDSEPKRNPFEECWAATSWTVNGADDENINQLVRCFNSPAPPVYFALTRALEAHRQDRDKQIQILEIFTYMLKKDHRFAIQRADNNSEFSWRILHQNETTKNDFHSDGKWHIIDPPNGDNNESFSNTLRISHYLLEQTMEASENQMPLDQRKVDALVDLALTRLRITLGTDIRGRSAADTAFAFAMAGITNSELYQSLATISTLELNRIGPRPSFPSKYILQIVEKLAAAGLAGAMSKPVYSLASDLLEHKKDGPPEETIRALRQSDGGFMESGFGLHSARSLLWLWRFSSRQSKAKITHKVPLPISSLLSQVGEEGEVSPSMQLFDDGNWVDQFDDCSRPLIVDVGAGMGVSLLGLARYGAAPETKSNEINPISSIDFRNCNYVGGDLSQMNVGYSRGIAFRWGLDGKTQFVHQTAESFLRQVQSYQGPVALIMIQFPTPFRLANKTSAESNSQLPADTASGFMVTPALLQTAHEILEEHGAYLLLHSNCEDVAVVMQEMALEAGKMPLAAPTSIKELGENKKDITQRTQEWIALGGRRPIGKEWSSRPFLPRYGQTETEVACEFQGTPIHRCLLASGRS